MTTFIEQIISWALALVERFGYGGIFLTMALESAAIPIPSEVVLPFSGFLASSGHFYFWYVVAVATAANLFGATIIYFVGFFGGRAILERYGKYVLVHAEEIEKFDRWLAKYGDKVSFFSRLLPGVRTFSSLIIGAGRADFKKFFWYTIGGSLIWNFALAYAGFAAGNHWDFLQPYFRKFELFIAAAVLIGIVAFVIKHLRGKGQKNTLNLF